VQYSILKQTAPGQDLNKEYLYAFIIEQNSIKLVKTPYPITRKELEKLSLDYIQTLQNYNGDIQNLLRASQPIYDTVIKPIKSSLPPTTSTIVIIPDEAMYSLPLELLVEPDTRRYLTESGWKNLVTEYAPSATVFLQSLIHDEKLANKEDNRTTFVGDPEFNQATFGRLPALPAAKEEVIKSTQLYENNYLEHELLLGSRATKEKLLKATETTHILHFSGHAEESLSSPLNSKLILAGEDQLYAWEIYQQHFPKTRLVILAACSTAQGKAKAGEGLLSLGRAFLAAGVPAVVASRWKVADSPAAVEFFTTFHKHLIVGKNAVQALHQAQRHMLNHSNVEFHHPAYWGAFMVMGGSATMDTN
jgi:CHAT domain-containing protein